jgi:hypothetical protein
MKQEERKPDRIVRVGNREFKLYKYFDESDGQYILDYPDFDENPEYTGEGRPYKQQVYESCPHAEDGEGQDPGDCGGCKYFHRDEPYAPIGICMCEELRLAENKNKSEEEPK